MKYFAQQETTFSTAPNTGKRQSRITMSTIWGRLGFEFRGFGVGMIAYTNDFEVSVGPFAVTLLSDCMALRGPRGERAWSWGQMRAWLTGTV